MENGLTTKFPLPEGVADAVMNRGQLARAFDKSENTIDKWRKSGMPCISEGTNGVGYEFQLSECWAWKLNVDDKARATQKAGDDAAAQLRMKFLGVDSEDSGANLSAAQKRELAQAEITWMQAAERRRSLIPLEDVVDLVESLMGQFRSALDGQPDWLEREFGLDGEQVARVQKFNDQILRQAHDEIQQASLEEMAPDVLLDGGRQAQLL